MGREAATAALVALVRGLAGALGAAESLHHVAYLGWVAGMLRKSSAHLCSSSPIGIAQSQQKVDSTEVGGGGREGVGVEHVHAEAAVQHV